MTLTRLSCAGKLTCRADHVRDWTSGNLPSHPLPHELRRLARMGGEEVPDARAGAVPWLRTGGHLEGEARAGATGRRNCGPPPSRAVTARPRLSTWRSCEVHNIALSVEDSHHPAGPDRGGGAHPVAYPDSECCRLRALLHHPRMWDNDERAETRPSTSCKPTQSVMPVEMV